MEFRQAVETDIDSVMSFIEQARVYFNAHDIPQWQNNYPNPKVLMKDIGNKTGFSLIKDDNLVGYVSAIFDGEQTYDVIYDGKWLSIQEFVVIHRLVIDSKYKGLGFASLIIENVEKLCSEKGVKSIKVDTHKNNLPMQNLLKKNGFQYCGIIYLLNGQERMAFEKLL